MRKFAGAALVAALFAIPATAQAAPSSHGQCRQALHDLYIAGSEEGTVGDFISDGFYGNEPNEVDGHTVPSQSPGPKVTNPDGSVRPGASWGDVQQTVIKPACNA
jgi:hypothetical protein